MARRIKIAITDSKGKTTNYSDVVDASAGKVYVHNNDSVLLPEVIKKLVQTDLWRVGSKVEVTITDK